MSPVAIHYRQHQEVRTPNTKEGASNAHRDFSFRAAPPSSGTLRRGCLEFPRQSDEQYLRIIFIRAISRRQHHEYVVVDGIPRNLPVVSRLAKTRNETCSVRPSFPLSAVATLNCKDGEVTIRNRLDASCLLLSASMPDFPNQPRTAAVGMQEEVRRYITPSLARARASQSPPTPSTNGGLQPRA